MVVRQSLWRLVTPGLAVTVLLPSVWAGRELGPRTGGVERHDIHRIAVPQRPVRVAIGSERGIAPIALSTTDDAWRLTDSAGRVVLTPSERSGWGIERRGRRLRGVHAGGATTPWMDGSVVVLPENAESLVRWGTRTYRGQLAFVATDSATVVVNVVEVEEYLRGVVPLEIGRNTPTDHAAIEAQAVTARSFTYLRMMGNTTRAWDVVAGTTDQVYGGVGAETAYGSLAVDATAGVMLTYQGRPVSGPYHSTCGGTTAEPSEVWRTGASTYLRSVADRAPSGKDYCEISPHHRWERVFTAGTLSTLVDRYLRSYAAVPAGDVGELRGVEVEGDTPSGRVRSTRFATARGSWSVRGNDVRYVLRGVGGELLPSTYFSLEPVVGPGGRLTQLTVRGRGNGHGVGMCQWGAIGRARAGQTFREILRAYFPGTEIARAA